MLADVSFVVATLSTGNKIGLAVVGLAFIVFALVSSFVLPRRNPDFPGKHLGWYVTVCVIFFVAMLSAVVVFGRESAAKGGETSAVTSTAAATTTAPATTTTPATTTAPAGGGAQPVGDPAAGKAVFASAGCAGCHTLKAAGATGKIGPNLDQLKPPEERVKTQVERGGGPMPAFQGQLTAKQIQDVAAFVSSSAG